MKNLATFFLMLALAPLPGVAMPLPVPVLPVIAENPNDVQYVRALYQAQAIGDPWARFLLLTEGGRGSAWLDRTAAPSIPYFRWCAASIRALLDAIDAGDRRAVLFVFSTERDGSFTEVRRYALAKGVIAQAGGL